VAKKLLPFLDPQNYPGETLSSVAGIIDPHGGIRFVVSEEWRIFEHHVLPEEVCFVVPDFRIKEPVVWDYIPTLIRRVELYILWWLETRNAPLEIRRDPIWKYLNNPEASHNLRPDEFRHVDLSRIFEVVK
jgi:hypothetical protein